MSLRTHWLPTLPDPDAAFAGLRSEPDPRRRLDQIQALAAHQLDYVQTGKLDRQLERVLAEMPEPAGLQPIRVAWLGSSTLDHLLPATRIAGLRRGLLVQSYLADYGQYRQELLVEDSGLARFRPQVVVLSLDHEHMSFDAPLTWTAGDLDAHIEQQVRELRQLWAIAAQRLNALVIQQTIPNVAPPLFGSYDSLLPASPMNVIDRLNRAIVAAAAETRTVVLDLARHVARSGIDAWFDRVRWHQAKQLVAPAAAPYYGELVGRLLGAARGKSRKCLVLDLDNTIWGGVVGDDGVDRLVLGPGSASGEAYAGFQRYARRLKERGIVLAVCSKNDTTIAQSAFTQHPEMVLALDDFGVFVASWDDKATNLKRIAEALNIGLDSLVFFDDNPVERALVRQELPMVAVPEVPEDPAEYVCTLAEAGYFEAVSFSDDDLARARQYADNGRRVRELEAATDMPTFLAGLQMKLQIGLVDERSLVRVTQLINKTNQFNVTTRRYTEPEVRAFAGDKHNLALHFRLIDRFGDNGLISVLLARGDGGGRLVVDTLLMSCRVLGRGVEQAILNTLVQHASRLGTTEIIGEYIPTAKNAMVSDLFPRLGFAPDAESATRGGATRWKLRVAEYTPHATFIEAGDAP
jgi:FkbH-like protein